MNNGKVRIYELSRELDLDNKDILAICDRLAIAVKSHSSTITESDAERIRAASVGVSKRSLQKPTRPVRKQQIVEVRRRQSSSPQSSREKVYQNPAFARPQRPSASNEDMFSQDIQSSEVSISTAEPSLTQYRTQRTGRGYIEPQLLKLLPEALPLHMVLIPAGTFLMGSPADEPEREDREGPQHPVTVPPFFMARYPITQAQWRAVVSMDQVERSLESAPSDFQGQNRPVENVSWYDAVEFCQRLAKHTGRPYRLPTEAEWEYACRAGTTTPFYFGKTLTPEIANYDGNYTYNDGPEGEYRQETTPVNHFGIANAFGLSDMHGNVLEWCQDQYHKSYDRAPANGSAWEDRDQDDPRILRGGSCNSYPRGCRSALRYNFNPDLRSNDVGFRVVCSAPRALQ
ncbi:hypothetical protein Lepto7375DRAFT_0911 [Leptolyngbya sp. PCC 7375]|nr:hypothetical protein Lepto7375DRAFT_0911 [Leptolyngbya sp. PCC 7375]